MTTLTIRMLVVILVFLAVLASLTLAAQVRSPSPLVAVENEPAPTLVVHAPLPGPLARGAVVIPYRVENFRILPVLGAAAVHVSPRAGHLHVGVDDLPWYWGDFSDSKTVVVNGLPPGQHKVLIQLADPEHRIFTAHTLTFTVPGSPK